MGRRQLRTMEGGQHRLWPMGPLQMCQWGIDGRLHEGIPWMDLSYYYYYYFGEGGGASDKHISEKKIKGETYHAKAGDMHVYIVGHPIQHASAPSSS
jgi:hypothetical protein